MIQEQAALLAEAVELLRTASRRIYRAGTINPHPDVKTSLGLGMICGQVDVLAIELEDMIKTPDLTRPS